MAKKIIALVLFLLSLWLVTKGMRISGYNGILMMLAGAGILLSELYVYNKRYQ